MRIVKGMQKRNDSKALINDYNEVLVFEPYYIYATESTETTEKFVNIYTNTGFIQTLNQLRQLPEWFHPNYY